ncbi:MAG: Gfo/Idh/MocA family protein [Longimicrobiales bacterium]
MLMKALLGGAWRDGLLDYHRGPDDVRVDVVAWRTLGRVEGAFFVRRRSLRMLWNYARELGAREVLRKVVSRWAEAGRNEKFVSAGYGRVLDAPRRAGLERGDDVVFIAPAHPVCVDRIALPATLVRRSCGRPPIDGSGIAHVMAPAEGPWNALAGWSPESGAAAPEAEAALERANALLEATDWRAAQWLDRSAPETGERVSGGAAMASSKPRALLIGYGNYAKTVVMAGVRRTLDVVAIHEIDPVQIGEGSDVALDTAPAPREDEAHDVLLIAGYHHTHAPLAVEALRAGRWAVVEKPVATTRAQLDELVAEIRRSPRLFSCFQKRYSSLNALALEDLGVEPGGAVSYHCIVYEVPLPPLHWYRWPNSRGRLVSNGCHWTDHFLHLNGYPEVVAYGVFEASDGTLNATVELANGAVFTMVLTEHGSERIGMQDHVELRANGVTVRIDNSSRYEAEGPDRVLRRKRVNRIEAYRTMYDTIGRRIVAGEAGDAPEAVERSAGLVLDLERRSGEIRDEVCATRWDATIR